jgi:hypothetical protein
VAETVINICGKFGARSQMGQKWVSSSLLRVLYYLNEWYVLVQIHE